MITVVSYYFMLLILLQQIEEIHNCNNPNTIGIIPHYVCDWDEDDFYTNVNGKKILRPKRKKDNKIKAYYRAKYWSNKWNT